MSIYTNYYVIAGYDLTGLTTDKFNEWRWGKGEQFFNNQHQGNVQLFDDPVNGEHLYLGYIFAVGGQEYMETTYIDIEGIYNIQSFVRQILDELIDDWRVIKLNPAAPTHYQIIAFEECS